MKRKIQLNINGEAQSFEVDPQMTLLELLRDEMGLTGTKEGCDGGECGSCTVLMNQKAVLSCITLAVDSNEKNILTIEGLASGGKLHPLQEAFIQHGAVQCGYCTPGMILSAKALLDENPLPTEAEIREAICGNVCRCTGYVKIVEAVSSAKNEVGGENG